MIVSLCVCLLLDRVTKAEGIKMIFETGRLITHTTFYFTGSQAKPLAEASIELICIKS